VSDVYLACAGMILQSQSLEAEVAEAWVAEGAEDQNRHAVHLISSDIFTAQHKGESK
jgi:hypothetical protein